MSSRRLLPPPDVWPLIGLVGGATTLSALVGVHHLMHNTDISPKLIRQEDPRVPRFEGPLELHPHFELFPPGAEINRKLQEHERNQPALKQ